MWKEVPGIVGLSASYFYRTLMCAGTPSPVALPFPTSIQSFLDHFTVSSCWSLPLRSLVCFVLIMDRVNCIGRGGWGGRTIIRIYYIRKNLFAIKLYHIYLNIIF